MAPTPDAAPGAGRRRSPRAGGYVLSTSFLVIFAILLVAVFVGLAVVRNALVKKASGEVIKDSASPPAILGKPIGWGICEEPQLLCKDPGRGTMPDPAAGMWALVGVRPDRFVTRNAVYYTNADCADTASASDVYVAPPAAPVPLGDLIPDLPVGYLDGLETVGQMLPLSYGVGAPKGFVFATQMPTGPGLLYRSADEAITAPLIRSVWTSLAPDCVLEAIPGGVLTGMLNCPLSGSPGTVAAEQKFTEGVGGFGGDLDANERFGIGLGSLGDLDGDSFPDVAVGARADDDGGTDRGAVWIVFLNADGTVKSEQKISDTVGGFTGTLSDFDEFGWGVEGLGDLDGDGVTDIAVGARWDDDGGGANRGAVWILFLNSDGTVKAHQKISATTGGLTGPLDNGGEFGVSITKLGDLDNDGVTDIAVGAFRDDDGGTDAGAVWILFLNADGTVKAEQKISNSLGGLTGPLAADSRFGSAVSPLGDLDGDGVEDLGVGSNRDDQAGMDNGAVWVLFLNTSGTVKAEQKITEGVGGFTGVLDTLDRFGTSVAMLGDIDGDTVTDVAVGAVRDDDAGTDNGAIWVLFLDTDGMVKGHQKITEGQGGFTGPLDADIFGTDAANLGDLDGDGLPELAVGAILDDDAASDAGAVWILFLNGVPTPTSCVPPPTGIAGWWPGDGNAEDIVGGNNGTLVGGASATATGQVDQAFSFANGTAPCSASDAVDVGDLGITGDWTVDFWTRANGPFATLSPTIQYPLGLATPPSPRFGAGVFMPFHSSFPDRWGLYDGTAVLLGSSILADTWYHLAVTKSGATYTLYLNGVADGSGTLLDIDLDNLQIGRRVDGRPPCSGPAWGFNGLVDEVEVFDRVLTACEIQQIYLAGAFGKCKEGEEVFPDELCENITPRSLTLIRAEEVVVDPSMAGSANLLEGPPYVTPFNIMPPMAGETAPTPESSPAAAPSVIRIAPAPEGTP